VENLVVVLVMEEIGSVLLEVEEATRVYIEKVLLVWNIF
jgi:hypothetical protein